MVGKVTADTGAAKTTPLGGKVWFCLLFFGLIGQIAWIVENMYFAKFMQDEFVDEAWATTLMVALSAVFTLIPAVIVRSKDAETRARLLAERDAEKEETAADEMHENEVESDVSAQ